jgi:hypothetical protein
MRGAPLAGAVVSVLAGCHAQAPDQRPQKPAPLAITLKTEGGFAYVPGLNRPIVVNTADLPEEQARALDDLVRRARFFALPPAVGNARPNAADVRTYELTVAGDRGTHTVRATEPIEDPALAALIQRVQAQSR